MAQQPAENLNDLGTDFDEIQQPSGWISLDKNFRPRHRVETV